MLRASSHQGMEHLVQLREIQKSGDYGDYTWHGSHERHGWHSWESKGLLCCLWLVFCIHGSQAFLLSRIESRSLLAQIITVLLSQPEPFKSLTSTSKHVKRPSLDLLIFHDAAENSAIAVAMLCFSQLQRQMFAPRGFVSSKLGKQNARWTLNKSLLPYGKPIQTIAPRSNIPSMIREVARQKLDLLAQHLQDLFELNTSTLQKTLPEACDNSHWPWQLWFRECSQANSICMVLQCTTHV